MHVFREEMHISTIEKAKTFNTRNNTCSIMSVISVLKIRNYAATSSVKGKLSLTVAFV